MKFSWLTAVLVGLAALIAYALFKPSTAASGNFSSALPSQSNQNAATIALGLGAATSALSLISSNLGQDSSDSTDYVDNVGASSINDSSDYGTF